MKKIFHSFIVFTFIFILLISFQRCDFSKNEKTSKIEQLIDYCYNNGIFNGSLLVSEGDRLVYHGAKGYIDFSTRQRLTTDSPFYLASVTKQFTAMAIMILNEQGKLNYNDQLSKYFPEFPDYADSVTIRNLLNHTSGIADYFTIGSYTPGLTNADVLEVLQKRRELDFKPNERYGYSNSGYVLLAFIVEKVSGQSFGIFLKEHIFNPLQMDHTIVFDQTRPAIQGKVSGYDMLGAPADYDILTFGDGGMFSTTGDMYKWDQALYTNELVSQDALQEAFNPARLLDGTSTGYGFGWGITTVGTSKIISHGGGYGGFRSYIERDTKRKSAIIILSNIGDATPVNEIAQAIRNVLNNEEMQLPRIPISLKMYTIIRENGLNAAIEKYTSLKVNEPSRYDFNEPQLNGLGYHFLHAGETDLAIEMFKLNAREFPESSNVYDSLGEAFLAKNDYVQASQNYQRSLALDPKNTNAIDMLQRIAKEKFYKPVN